MFTDGSVVRGTKSGWAFSARDGDSLVRVREMSGATEVTTSSMYMEVIAITESLKWLKDTAFESATIVTDSLCTLEKVRNGMLYADWKGNSWQQSVKSGMDFLFGARRCSRQRKG